MRSVTGYEAWRNQASPRTIDFFERFVLKLPQKLFSVNAAGQPPGEAARKTFVTSGYL